MTIRPVHGASQDDVAAAYANSLERWGTLQRKPNQANLEFDRGEALLSRLVVSESGRTAVESLLTHPDQWVRLRAASHALGWAPELAASILEELAARGTDGCGVSAKYTLIEFRKGSLQVVRPTE